VTPEADTAGQIAGILAERDAIQANLLELDGSFGRRALEGAALSGETRLRWDRASGVLSGLWETFLAYSAVVDRISVLASARRRARKEQSELAGLLSGGCVQLAAGPLPLANRDLAVRGRPPVTLRTAVGAMRRAFAEVIAVTGPAEAVWSAIGAPLDAATAELDRDRLVVAGLGPALESELGAAAAAIAALRSAANADPLALWHDGQADTAAADQLRAQVAALTDRITQLDQVRRQARARIDDLAEAAAAARADRGQAVAAWQEATTRVGPLPPLPDAPDALAEPPLPGLSALAAAGQWDRLAAELDQVAAQLGQAAARTAELRQAVADALGRREELRGLLGAYKAKAARLGAAEDENLAAPYDEAYGLLWTAPCDLAAAAAAVAAYQRAVRATEGRE
jgi:hypothetical protein